VSDSFNLTSLRLSDLTFIALSNLHVKELISFNEKPVFWFSVLTDLFHERWFQLSNKGFFDLLQDFGLKLQNIFLKN
jgi:hypothetical protein